MSPAERITRGHWRSEEPTTLLAQLLRNDRRHHMGRRFGRPYAIRRLQARAALAVARRGSSTVLTNARSHGVVQRLSGATLLVLANKQDLSGAASVDDIRQVGRLLLVYT